jgi:hypothetical protein
MPSSILRTRKPHCLPRHDDDDDDDVVDVVDDDRPEIFRFNGFDADPLPALGARSSSRSSPSPHRQNVIIPNGARYRFFMIHFQGKKKKERNKYSILLSKLP